jgi:alcohol dehydrogenase
MGFKVAAIGRGDDITDDVLSLGAHVYIDNFKAEPAARLSEMGGAQAILTTITDSAAASALMPGLAPQGKLIVLGVGKDPLTISPGQLVVGERMVMGTITGTPMESEKTLDFSVLAGIRPLIETMPLIKAYEAYQRVVSGQVKFRMVLTIDPV